MNMDIVGFYNNLFAIEIAVFGIISAVVLVFVQLVYSSFSYRHIGSLLKNRYLILYFIFSSLDLLLTAAGSYFLSFKHHDLFPGIYLYTDLIINSSYYALVCLLLIFLSISFFVILILKNISYLQPHRALFLILKKVKYKDTRDYLLKKYGLEAPLNIKFIFPLVDKKKSETKKQYESRVAREQKEKEAEIHSAEEAIKKVKKEVENKEDPFSPIWEMIVQFIRRTDFRSIEDSRKLLTKISAEFYENLPVKQGVWFPEEKLGVKFVLHSTEFYRNLLEIARREELETAEKLILDISYDLGLVLLEKRRYDELDKLAEFWKDTADGYIGRSSFVFQRIMNYYNNIGNKLFDIAAKDKTSKKEEVDTMLENIFRYVAWLGERLLIKVPIEESPIIRVFDHSTEYDALYNCLLSFSHRYDFEFPHKYPLIYFDALYVILDKLIGIYKQKKDYDLGNNMFNIFYAFASFAENAIRAKNSSGAALAAMRIKEAYDKLKSNGLDEQANDCIKLLVRVGMLAATHKDELKRVEFMDKPIDEYAMDEIVRSGEDVSGEVYESYIKLMGGDHDKRWGFLTTLGMRLGTNFGFMFDPATGQLYADDDPRRR